MDIDDIDIERLREDLEEYFTSAMFMVSEFAMIDMVDVKTASPEELLEIANKNICTYQNHTMILYLQQ